LLATLRYLTLRVWRANEGGTTDLPDYRKLSHTTERWLKNQFTNYNSTPQWQIPVVVCRCQRITILGLPCSFFLLLYHRVRISITPLFRRIFLIRSLSIIIVFSFSILVKSTITGGFSLCLTLALAFSAL